MKILDRSLNNYEKKVIIDTWDNLGNPNICAKTLMNIRKVTHNGLYDIKKTILDYCKTKSFN